MTINYDDPAAVLAILRPAYIALLAGGKALSVDIPTPGGSPRRVTYHQTDLKMLRDEVRRLKAIVAANATGKPRRGAFRPG